MATSFIQPGKTVSYVVAGAVVTQGLLIVRDGVIGIVDLPNGTTGALTDRVQVHTEGAFTYDKAAVAFTFGQDVYFDAANDLITTVAAGNTLVGVALGTLGVMAGAGAGLAETFKLIGSASTILAAGGSLPVIIADPGDGLAIAVTHNGHCALTSAGVGETRTMAIPTLVGQKITLGMDVDGGGNIVVTVAGGIDSAGNTTITLGDAHDGCALEAMQVAGAAVWTITGNAGCALA